MMSPNVRSDSVPDDVVVDVGHRDRVLDAGVAVDDLRHVVLELHPALGDYHDAQLPAGGDDLLALVAARLPTDGYGSRLRVSTPVPCPSTP